LAGLLHTDEPALRQIKGLGPAKRAEVVAVLELARRTLMQPLHSKPVFDSPQAVRQYLQLLAGGATLTGVDLDAAESPLVQ
jgi:DNA repair protein RadC